MLPVFADPKTGVVFKRIFGTEARKPLLIALLNHLLELDWSILLSPLRSSPLDVHRKKVTPPLGLERVSDNA